MKSLNVKISGLLVVMLVVSFSFNALAGGAKLIDHPGESLKLTVPGDKGTNGSAVAYNDQNGLYYTVTAGNAAYPLATFDKSGKHLHTTVALNDMRGMWWNGKTKNLEGNCYSSGGIVSISVEANGYAGGGNSTLFEGGDHQPNEHSCGTYDPKKKMILYYDGGKVYRYSRKTGNQASSVSLTLPTMSGNINSSSMIFTGVKKMEYGLLDHVNKKVYLFNAKNGKHTATVTLPSNAITNSMFRFGYANGHIFLYDVGVRTWIGYKIFG